MNILIDINHPADVHQFKYPIRELQKKHNIKIVARDKDCVHELLKELGIPFTPRKGYTTLLGKLLGFLLIDFKLYNIAKEFSADVLVGSSGNLYVAHAAKLLGKPSIVFDDTEHAKLQNMLCFPFATKIVTPETYTLKLGKKHITYPGSKELGYLDPRYFRPKKSLVKTKKNEKLIFIRLVSWDANHDVGKSGIDAEKLVEQLLPHGKIVISSEKELSETLKRYEIQVPSSDIHTLLYQADLVISEGGTMAVEAAVMGTPTIYANALKMGYSDDLVTKKRMVQSTDGKDIAKQALSFLKKKKKSFLTSSLDLNKFISEQILEVAT